MRGGQQESTAVTACCCVAACCLPYVRVVLLPLYVLNTSTIHTRACCCCGTCYARCRPLINIFLRHTSMRHHGRTTRLPQGEPYVYVQLILNFGRFSLTSLRTRTVCQNPNGCTDEGRRYILLEVGRDPCRVSRVVWRSNTNKKIGGSG